VLLNCSHELQQTVSNYCGRTERLQTARNCTLGVFGAALRCASKEKKLVAEGR